MDAFLARPWFARRWILQEVKLAHVVTVHFGPYRIAWAWIRHGMENLSDRTSPQLALMLPSIFGALEGFTSLEHNINPTTMILELLWDFHFNLCRDERDQLFALYGIGLELTDRILIPMISISLWSEVSIHTSTVLSLIHLIMPPCILDSLLLH